MLGLGTLRINYLNSDFVLSLDGKEVPWLVELHKVGLSPRVCDLSSQNTDFPTRVLSFGLRRQH